MNWSFWDWISALESTTIIVTGVLVSVLVGLTLWDLRKR